MRLSRALIVPHVVRLGLRAPREASTRWERYWAAVRTTGDGGDVLWDSSRPDEARGYLDLLAAHADPGLPVVDLGCGNGRFARALAARYPRVLGVDLAAAAVERAREETRSADALRYRALDVTTADAGRRLREDLAGNAHVFVRGVLHVLDADARRRLAANALAVVGTTGVVLVAETNHPGSALSYLESLGANARGIPGPLARAIESGLPTPRPFGRAELDACFPVGQWERLVVDDDAEITAVPLRQPGVPERIPGFVALLRARSRALAA